MATVQHFSLIFVYVRAFARKWAKMCEICRLADIIVCVIHWYLNNSESVFIIFSVSSSSHSGLRKFTSCATSLHSLWTFSNRCGCYYKPKILQNMSPNYRGSTLRTILHATAQCWSCHSLPCHLLVWTDPRTTRIINDHYGRRHINIVARPKGLRCQTRRRYNFFIAASIIMV